MIFAAYFFLRGRDTHIDFLRLLFLVGVTCPLMQEHSLRLKKLISQAPEDVMLKIGRPVYKRLFKSNRMLHANQKSNVNQMLTASVLAKRSLHQELMHSRCCGMTVSHVCLQPLTLSFPSPCDFFTLSPNRGPAHRLVQLDNLDFCIDKLECFTGT